MPTRPALGLLLCILTTVPMAASAANAQASARVPTPQLTFAWPVGHLAAYDFTVPDAQVAAIVPENGVAKPGLFNARIYEIHLSHRYANQGVSAAFSTSLLAMALTSGQSVKGIAMVGMSCSASYSGTSTSDQSLLTASVPLPRSINADGTVNWEFEFQVGQGNQGQSGGSLNLEFTGFLAPSNGLLTPATVYLRPDGSRLKITYVRGKFITVTADVGEPIQRVLGSVDLDDHRTVILVETQRGVRALLLDRSSGTVRRLSNVKVGRDDYGGLTFVGSLAIAVPEPNGATLALLTPGMFRLLTPATVVRIRGNVRVLDVRPYLTYILAAAEVNGTLTLLAVDPLTPRLLPVKKESDDA
ncbi:MAG: hypothetical protein ABGY09_02590, partial [Euryarchaeota archaeon]